MTVSFQDPVRVNVALKLGPYTFMKRVGTGFTARLQAINLNTDFAAVSVTCQVKPPGLGISTVTASFVDKPSGVVQVDSYTPTVLGIWQYQFFAADGSGNRLAGEPVQFTVYKNEEDADDDELLKV